MNTSSGSSLKPLTTDVSSARQGLYKDSQNEMVAAVLSLLLAEQHGTF